VVTNAVAAAAVRGYNSAAAEPFANGTTASYVEEMYNNWLRDPTSVHTVVLGCLFPKQLILWPTNLAPQQYNTLPVTAFGGMVSGAAPDSKTIDDHLAVRPLSEVI
ncbi:2-oxoglutarate dehydrogenase-like, mitochondrial, partial [Eumeta japonica]